MKMEEKVLVLGVRPFDFKDRETGRQVQGMTVHYIGGESSKGDQGLGWEPQKITVPMAFFESVVQVPGFYTLAMDLQRGRDGRMNARGSSLRYETGADIVAEVDALGVELTPVVK